MTRFRAGAIAACAALLVACGPLDLTAILRVVLVTPSAPGIAVPPTRGQAPDTTPVATPTGTEAPGQTPRPEPSGEPTPSETPGPTPTAGADPSPPPSAEPGASPTADPVGTPGPTPTPTPSPTPTPIPTPIPGALVLRSLTGDTGFFVYIGWDASLGTATSLVRIQGLGQTFVPSGTSHIDNPPLAAPVTYVLVAGGKQYTGAIEPAGAYECVIGGGEGKCKGPGECQWVPKFGATPVEMSADPCNPGTFDPSKIPVAPKPLRLPWTDTGKRLGYVVDVGPGVLAHPPVTTPVVVGLTGGLALDEDTAGAIPGLTDDPVWQKLLAVSGFATKPWPQASSGTLMGWRLRPIALSSDGRSAAITAPPPFPRIYKLP